MVDAVRRDVVGVAYVVSAACPGGRGLSWWTWPVVVGVVGVACLGGRGLSWWAWPLVVGVDCRGGRGPTVMIDVGARRMTPGANLCLERPAQLTYRNIRARDCNVTCE